MKKDKKHNIQNADILGVDYNELNLKLEKEIKESKQAEIVLGKEKYSLRNILETMPDGVYISDQQYNLLFANKYFVKEFGAYEGRKCYEYFRDRKDVCSWCNNKKVFDGKFAREESYNIKNGKIYDVIGTSIILQDGSSGKLEIFRDISKRKQAEEALEKSEGMLHLVLNNSPQLIFWKDRNSVILGCNQGVADYYNIKSHEDIIGKTDYDFKFTKEVADSYREMDRRVMESGIPEYHVVEHTHKPDGTEIWLDINRIPMRDDKNEVVGVLVTVEDITERKRMEEKQLAHLYFVDNLERIDGVMRKSMNVDQMLHDVLETVLDIFECDRAWLLSPCDPDADTWSVPMECTKPEYPGAYALGEDILMTPEMSELFRNALKKNNVIIDDSQKFGIAPDISKKFSIKTWLYMAVYPQTGKPWIFGLHQCSHFRKWTKDEQDLFREIGRRIGDDLSVMFSMNELRSREEKERDFRERLTKLHEVSIELSNCTIEDELWKQAIELGRGKLGFDRLGIWLKTKKTGELCGTFGTDINGNLVDERKYTDTINSDRVMGRALKLKTTCYFKENENILVELDKKIIGQAERAAAPLWDGDHVIGGIIMDNFIQHKAITENDRELLVLYASLLGHLATRIRNEKNEIDFQKKLAALHDVSTELSLCRTEDNLWQMAIKLGREKLGFDRLGIWLKEENSDIMHGTFGIDINGNFVDEHHLSYKLGDNPEAAMSLVIKHKDSIYYKEDDITMDDSIENVVGISEHAIAPLWDGDVVIGIISTDNFIQKNHITENDRELLMLYASFLGHFGLRQRDEEKRIAFDRKMLHAQKLESLGVLAGGIAHDFNNILMAVLGYSDLILQELPNYSPVRDDVNEIKKAASRAAELSRQMLAYSGKGKFVIEPIKLNDLVREMSRMLEVSISKKAVLKYDFADDLPMFNGDATQIRQIIMNMITNASEAIGDKNGVISISTGDMFCDQVCINMLDDAFRDGMYEPMKEGNYIYVEFSDTGCGMNMETKEKLFDPFFTTKFTGRGLGMAAVLGIVRGHNGAIKIYSELGIGTTFTVLFPITESIEQISDEKNSDENDKNKWAGSGTILIADDEKTVCSLGKRMIEMMGFNALTAADGQQAVDLFRENYKDIVCVILDMAMPRLSGEQAFREIKLIHKDVKVILSSGYSEEDATQHFYGKGLDGFIQKPYNMKKFAGEIQSVLES